MLRFLSILLLLMTISWPVLAQDEAPSLGEVARKARESKVSDGAETGSQKVIDNDNFSAVLDQAEAARMTGKPVFSIDPSGKAFRMTSPDGTCSLSFDAKATSLISTPYISSDLPQYEMAKLEGEAEVRDGVLEVKLHNGSEWELKEIVVGVTLLNQSPAGLQPA